MFYNNFTRLCTQKGIKPTVAAIEMGFSNSTASKWAKGSVPQGKSLQKIADYFGVTSDYLLGVESNDTEADISAEDREWLRRFKALSGPLREAVENIINANEGK